MRAVAAERNIKRLDDDLKEEEKENESVFVTSNDGKVALLHAKKGLKRNR